MHWGGRFRAWSDYNSNCAIVLLCFIFIFMWVPLVVLIKQYCSVILVLFYGEGEEQCYCRVRDNSSRWVGRGVCAKHFVFLSFFQRPATRSILGMYLFGGKFCKYYEDDGTERDCTCREIVEHHPKCECDRKHFNNILWATVTVFQVSLDRS